MDTVCQDCGASYDSAQSAAECQDCLAQEKRDWPHRFDESGGRKPIPTEEPAAPPPDLELCEVSAAKDTVLVALGDFLDEEEHDCIELADIIVENLLKAGVLIPAWMPMPLQGGKPAQGYYPTSSEMEAWAGRAVTPRRVTGR